MWKFGRLAFFDKLSGAVSELGERCRGRSAGNISISCPINKGCYAQSHKSACTHPGCGRYSGTVQYGLPTFKGLVCSHYT